MDITNTTVIPTKKMEGSIHLCISFKSKSFKNKKPNQTTNNGSSNMSVLSEALMSFFNIRANYSLSSMNEAVLQAVTEMLPNNGRNNNWNISLSTIELATPDKDVENEDAKVYFKKKLNFC
ncbi:hypothetical protein RCL_jg1973.t1 [Rhizophagus clarus]|uniref:Uncharacterized protein n=1 Tax=Rhizophagus clarus TaxID=94130 RepID=A0A8H3M2G2_9GLOM|nr:hypothetical protein RCL_jg1973.t1 [Rhizophagus clarus]